MAVVVVVGTMDREHLVHLKVTVDRVLADRDTDMPAELDLQVLGLEVKVIQVGMDIMVDIL